MSNCGLFCGIIIVFGAFSNFVYIFLKMDIPHCCVYDIAAIWTIAFRNETRIRCYTFNLKN